MGLPDVLRLVHPLARHGFLLNFLLPMCVLY
jgi:hypothetical protein